MPVPDAAGDDDEVTGLDHPALVLDHHETPAGDYLQHLRTFMDVWDRAHTGFKEYGDQFGFLAVAVRLVEFLHPYVPAEVLGPAGGMGLLDADPFDVHKIPQGTSLTRCGRVMAAAFKGFHPRAAGSSRRKAIAPHVR